MGCLLYMVHFIQFLDPCSVVIPTARILLCYCRYKHEMNIIFIKLLSPKLSEQYFFTPSQCLIVLIELRALIKVGGPDQGHGEFTVGRTRPGLPLSTYLDSSMRRNSKQ